MLYVNITRIYDYYLDSNILKPPNRLGCCPFQGRDYVVVDLLFVAALIVRGIYVFGPCFVK